MNASWWLVAVLGLGDPYCDRLEGYCINGLQMAAAHIDHMNGPEQSIWYDWSYVDVVGTVHFETDCPEFECVREYLPEEMWFACTFPDLPYSCYMQDTWMMGTYRFDLDRDGDIDLADFARFQNQEWEP